MASGRQVYNKDIRANIVLTGSPIMKLRRLAGISQSEAAERLGISRSQYQRIEYGEMKDVPKYIYIAIEAGAFSNPQNHKTDLEIRNLNWLRTNWDSRIIKDKTLIEFATLSKDDFGDARNV